MLAASFSGFDHLADLASWPTPAYVKAGRRHLPGCLRAARARQRDHRAQHQGHGSVSSDVCRSPVLPTTLFTSPVFPSFALLLSSRVPVRRSLLRWPCLIAQPESRLPDRAVPCLENFRDELEGTDHRRHGRHRPASRPRIMASSSSFPNRASTSLLSKARKARMAGTSPRLSGLFLTYTEVQLANVVDGRRRGVDQVVDGAAVHEVARTSLAKVSGLS